jgi:hypothetical protein
MPEALTPASSEELSRWLRHARESRATIERGIRGLDKALNKIEQLVAQVPPAAANKKDGPTRG